MLWIRNIGKYYFIFTSIVFCGMGAAIWLSKENWCKTSDILIYIYIYIYIENSYHPD